MDFEFDNRRQRSKELATVADEVVQRHQSRYVGSIII